ncbi:MlaD family protein [Nocardioides sp.]|uniref:MlaD family protein n=1 Tax=Nocardioides sp. TaxID=35761 RepID=UPI003515A56E
MAIVFLFLWSNSGGRLPVGGSDYQVTLQSQDLQNLVENSDVTMAGVKVGSVLAVDGRGENATAVIALDDEVVPLHEGATFALRSKTLVEETYVDLTDGTGGELADDAVLPLSANSSSVHLDQVLAELTPKARESLGSLVRGAGRATDDRAIDIHVLLAGAGVLGEEGHDALSALAEQQADLVRLSRTSARVLAAFDERQGQVAHLVTMAQRNMLATARQRSSLEDTVRLLPGVLDSASEAAPALQTLASDLGPLASSLETAAPGLNDVLARLPQTTAELRDTFPVVSTVLTKAPATLDRIPALDSELEPLIPNVSDALTDLNPMIGYLSPYGRDLASFFANDSSVFGLKDETSRFVRVFAVLNSTSLVGNPIPTTGIGGVGQNPYPAPGTLGDPDVRFGGDYPKVEREE